MLSRAASARCFARLSKISRTLPETFCQRKGDHAAFLVRKKIFAYFLNNHHGDGIVAIACKAFPGENKSLIAAHPERYYLPAYIGPRGWVALRLDGREVDWEEAADVLKASYLLTAPRTLGARVDIPKE